MSWPIFFFFFRNFPLHIVNGVCWARAEGAGMLFNGTCTHQGIHWLVVLSKVDLHQGSQHTVVEYGQFTTLNTVYLTL